MSALLDIDAIRSANPLPAIVAASVKLRRAGREWKACCPFHADRSPSFTIFDGGQRFYCFGCGASGDVLDFLQRSHGVSMREAAAMLGAGEVPAIPVPALPPKEDSGETRARAVSLWRSAGPVAGTPAEAYLRGRGIHISLPETLRFARLRYGRSDRLPCLVALLANADDKISGIQRTFVKEDGSGKADVPAAKLSLGRITGAAIRLAPASSELVVTGGLEDGLTLQQELGRAVWCATGEGNLANLSFPQAVQSVTIGADNDCSGEAHARRAAKVFSNQGRSVRIIRPLTGFKDFSAELQGQIA